MKWHSMTPSDILPGFLCERDILSFSLAGPSTTSLQAQT